MTERPNRRFSKRPDPNIVRQVTEFLDAPTWETKKDLAQAHLDALSNGDARLTVDLLAEQWRDDPETLADLNNQRALIEACVLEGVDAAFESWLQRFPQVSWVAQRMVEVLTSFILAPTWIQSKYIVETHPILIHEAADGMLERIQVYYRDEENDPAFAEVVAHDHALLVACRTTSIESAFAECIRLTEQVIALLKASSEAEMRVIVDEHEELLSNEARQSLDGFRRKAEKRGDTEMASSLLWHLEWLDAQRRAALEERLNFQLTLATALVQRSIQSFDRNQDGSVSGIRIRAKPVQAAEGESSIVQTLNLALDMSKRLRAECPREVHPMLFARITALLGLAYRELSIFDERAANLERAIEHFKEALDVLEATEHGKQYANTLQNLGAAYGDRVLGDRMENLRTAWQFYERALSYYSRDQHPDWGSLQHNLGTLGLMLAESGVDASDNIERAIQYFEQALTVRADWTQAEARARTLKSLAEAYLTRLSGDRDDNVDTALAYTTAALAERSRDELPIEWALTMNLMGNVYSVRRRGDRTENVEQALKVYRQALTVLTDVTAPADHRMIQTNLGHLCFAEQRWMEAAAAYQAALASGTWLYLQAATPLARQSELARNHDLTARLAYALTKSDSLAEAVVACEEGRARGVAEVLNRSEAALQQAAPADRAEFEAARQHLAELERIARAAGSLEGAEFLALSDEIQDARRRLVATADRIRHYVPEFMPAALDINQIQATAQSVGQPLIYMLTTERGSLALMVPPGPDVKPAEVVWLDDFSLSHLAELLTDSEGTPGYLHGALGDNSSALRTALDRVLPTISKALMTPLVDRLLQRGWQRAVLIPLGALGLLPLPAPNIATVTLSFVPSARTLQSAVRLRDERVAASRNFLGIGNPLPHPTPLPYARLEVVLAQTSLSNGSYLYCELEATRAVVTSRALAATQIHLACHGQFNIVEPLDSTLALAGGDRLTLRDVLDGNMHFPSARLVVLSACESGITEFQRVPDEVIGFPTGFLMAGVPAVIGTLWPVNDISTALLMSKFYEYYLKGPADPTAGSAHPAVSLCQAQLWLRDATNDYLAQLFAKYLEIQPSKFVDSLSLSLIRERFREHALRDPNEKPYAHPYYWAAFAFYGI